MSGTICSVLNNRPMRDASRLPRLLSAYRGLSNPDPCGLT